MHKTHGRVVQAVDESYDNHIRIYSRPGETKSYSPSCKPEPQVPLKEQEMGTVQSNIWSPLTKTNVFFVVVVVFIVDCWFININNDATVLDTTNRMSRWKEGLQVAMHFWHAPEAAFRLTFFRRIQSDKR